MFKTIVLCTALITFAMALSLNAQPQPSPVQPAPVKRTILQRADVPGTNLEIIYATVEIAPGFKAGRHNHPGVVMAHIIEGDFWLQLNGEPDREMGEGGEVRGRQSGLRRGKAPTFHKSRSANFAPPGARDISIAAVAAPLAAIVGRLSTSREAS